MCVNLHPSCACAHTQAQAHSSSHGIPGLRLTSGYSSKEADSLFQDPQLLPFPEHQVAVMRGLVIVQGDHQFLCKEKWSELWGTSSPAALGDGGAREGPLTEPSPPGYYLEGGLHCKPANVCSEGSPTEVSGTDSQVDVPRMVAQGPSPSQPPVLMQLLPAVVGVGVSHAQGEVCSLTLQLHWHWKVGQGWALGDLSGCCSQDPSAPETSHEMHRLCHSQCTPTAFGKEERGRAEGEMWRWHCIFSILPLLPPFF